MTMGAQSVRGMNPILTSSISGFPRVAAHATGCRLGRRPATATAAPDLMRVRRKGCAGSLLGGVTEEVAEGVASCRLRMAGPENCGRKKKPPGASHEAKHTKASLPSLTGEIPAQWVQHRPPLVYGLFNANSVPGRTSRPCRGTGREPPGGLRAGPIVRGARCRLTAPAWCNGAPGRRAPRALGQH